MKAYLVCLLFAVASANYFSYGYLEYYEGLLTYLIQIRCTKVEKMHFSQLPSKIKVI
jgi:hypothetical protein